MYAQKGGSKSGEVERQSILQQMKVRNTLKKDKSWIHEQQSLEEQKDENTSPMDSPLGSSKAYNISSSPGNRPKSNREPFWNTEDSDRLSLSPPSAPTLLKGSRDSLAKSIENDTATPSPPGPQNKSSSSTGYRGMYTIPLEPSSKVHQPLPANGYPTKSFKGQKTKSASLPRVPTASGYKMTTEDYKKLAPFNIRPSSTGDIEEDDDEPFSPEEHSKRSEAASSILKGTASKQRSYVLSAAKRSNGSPTQDIPTPFLAKRVEIQEDYNGDNKNHTLPAKMSPQFSTGLNSNEESKKIPDKSPTMETTTRTTFTSKESSNTYTKDPEWKSKLNPFSSAEMSMETTKKPFEPLVQNETKPKVISSSEKSSNTYTKDPEWKSKLNPFSSAEMSMETTKKPLQPLVENETKPKVIGSSEKSVDTARKPLEPLVQNETKSKVISSSEKSMETVKKPLEPFVQNETKPKVISSSEKSMETARKPLEPLVQNETKLKVISLSEKSMETTKKPLQPLVQNETKPKVVSSSEKSMETTKKPLQPLVQNETKPKVISSSEKSDDISRRSPTSSSSTVTRTTTTITKNESGEDGKMISSVTESRTIVTNKESDEKRKPPESSPITEARTRTTITSKESIESDKRIPEPIPRNDIKPKAGNLPEKRNEAIIEEAELISWTDPAPSKPSISTEKSEKKEVPKPAPRTEIKNRVSSNDSETTQPKSKRMEAPLIVISPELAWTSCYEDDGERGLITTGVQSSHRSSSQRSGGGSAITSRYTVPECLEDDPEEYTVSTKWSTPHPKENAISTTTRSSYTIPEYLSDQELESDPKRSSSRSVVTTTTSTTEPWSMVSDYHDDKGPASTRFTTSSRERTTTTTTTTMRETRYESPSATQYNKPDPNANSRGVFVKEYVDSSELSSRNPSSPVYNSSSGGNFSDDIERVSYNSNFSSLYSSAPRRSDEGPCTYCGREIRDCAKIILEHLNIYCHEYCFKCGICHKPMGDLIDSIFIHRDVVHCQSCYEKLF
ncbi:zinc finger protein 185 isoform X5 [Rhinatrema bivittatum]|uniref:zinc finger protein 185 isoform X5 n=1 Tax=Rhinatrema bivittatum TaxID=194408 RepID=UPI00112BB495|nr:zinc finger protein 185 isoform X5 [Rhinatrema bivittatum]